VLGAFARAPDLEGAALPVWRRLFHIGFPIMVAGALFTLFVTSDRWIAALLLGAGGAAPYALASLIGSAMIVLPTVVSQQTYPRMAIAYGQHHDEDRILAMARHQGAIAFALAAPVACIGAVAVTVLIPRVLPGYADSVWPSVIILFGLTPLAASSGYGNYLNVVGLQWTFLAVGVSSLSMGIVMMFIGGMGLGLIGIALGAAIAYFVYGSTLTVAALLTRRTRPLPTR
jgi:O-antigen/teichoic acid export membrane protein